MTLSSLSSTHSPSLTTQQPSTQAPGHLGTAPADALRPPEGMPAPRRAAPPGPSASTQPRAALPPATTQEIRLPANQARATAGTGEPANLPHGFGKPLALAADNYAALHKEIHRLGHGAENARAGWVANGHRKDLTAAQTQGIQGAVLNGLYSFRLHHKDWLSQTPMVSPAALADLLPLFRYALALCEKESDAVEFPIDAPLPQLAHLQTRVRESLQSLAGGQWQATADGESYAQRHGAMRGQHPGTLPAPFAGLQVTCRDLDQVLVQLQSALTRKSYTSVLSTDLPAAGNASSADTAPRQPAPPSRPPARPTDHREPRRTPHHRGPANLQGPKPTRARAVPGTAAPTLLHIRPAGPPALRPADTAVPSSPTATASPAAAIVAAPPPVDPVAEAAAQLRHEQLTALKAALAPLQDDARRLIDAAEAMASRNAPGTRPWELHTHEFKAWEAVVKAYDACTEKLKAEAGATSVLDSDDPAVRSLQGAIGKASGRALERAARAADDTLAAFAQTCHTALVHGDPEGAGVGSYAKLAEHCRELHGQWQETPLRPRLPALEGRMAQYDVYKTVCEVMDNDSTSKASILFKAEQVHEAATLSRRAFVGAHGALDGRLRAFRKSCTNLRSDMLAEVVRQEFLAVYDTYAGQDAQLQPARQQCAEFAAACDTLLIGNPLSQAQARAPGSPAAPVQGLLPALSQAVRSLIDDAFEAADTARTQREQVIELPAHDVPPREIHEQQGRLAVLQQVELSAETIAVVLERFHLLSETLGTTPPGMQPGLVGEHADAMEQRAFKLRKALLAHYATSDDVNDGPLSDLIKRGQAVLRADLRLTLRMHMSLKTLERLLDQRLSARRLRSALEQGRRPDLAKHPQFTGRSHRDIAEVLRTGMKALEQDLLEEIPKIKAESWKTEKDWHDLTASAMQCKIDGEAALIQGQLLLALDAGASPPGSGNPGRPDHLLGHRAKVAELFDSLTATNKTLKELAASSEHKDSYLEQHAINEGVRRGLLVLKLKLDALDSPPPGTAAGGSSQVDTPAARTSGTTPAAAEAPKGNKSSGRHRHAKPK